MGTERGDADGASLRSVSVCVDVPARRGADGKLPLARYVCMCSGECGHCYEWSFSIDPLYARSQLSGWKFGAFLRSFRSSSHNGCLINTGGN